MRRLLELILLLLAASAFAYAPQPARFSRFYGANRLTTTITPMLRKTSQVWNNRGLLQSVTDPMQQTNTFLYDERGRLTNRTDLVGTTAYQYDGNGNLTSVTNAGQASRLSWGYDAYDRVSAFTNADNYLIQYRYNANGSLSNLVYPGGKTVTYLYDSLNRLTNVTDWISRQTTFTYDLASRVASITRPNGTVRQINYDTAGETTNIIEKTTSGFPIAFFRLNWDNAARVQWEFAAPLPQTNTTPPTRTMTYDDDNRLKTFNGQTVTNDADGNLTWGPLTNNTLVSYGYDARNRLTNAAALTYGYDPAGNRTSVANGTNVVRFVVNPNAALPQMLIRTRPDGSQTFYVYGVGLLYEVNFDYNGTELNTRTYHYDYRGSTAAITDGSGNVTDRVQYSAYGMITLRGGTNDTPFLYNGRYGVMTDPNGLLYMRARYYNPYICRFINPDPSGFAGGLNWYCYADGNPISYRDPSGLGAVGDSTTRSWLTGSSATPTDLSNPFGLAVANEQDDWSDKAVDYINAKIDAYQQAQAARPAWAKQLDQFAQLAVMGMAPGAGLLGETAAAESGVLVRGADEAFSSALFQEATKTVENVGGFKLFGNKGLVGDTFNRNVFLIEAEQKGATSLRAMVNSLEGEARAAGANQLSIIGQEVINPGFLNPAVAQRYGFTFRQINPSTVQLIKALP